MLLQIKNLNVYYQAIHALKDINLEMNEGEMVALIGANGAGKSTLLKAISGILKPSSGNISYRAPNGNILSLNEMPADKIVASGVAQVPEGRQIFSNLSVKENLELGAYSRKGQINFKQSKYLVCFLETSI